MSHCVTNAGSMAGSNFSIRLDDETISSLDEIASECKVKRSNVIDWALEAYVELFKANGERMLTTSDMEFVLKSIREKALSKNSPFKVLRAAEEPHEPGKVINPAAAGGASTAHGTKYTKAKRHRSSS